MFMCVAHLIFSKYNNPGRDELNNSARWFLRWVAMELYGHKSALGGDRAKGQAT